MEQENNAQKKKKGGKIKSVIIIILLLIIAFLGLNIYTYVVDKPNIFDKIKEVYNNSEDKTETQKETENNKVNKVFSRGSYETIRLYEDNKLTISFSETGAELFGNSDLGEAFDLKANVEYEIEGLENKRDKISGIDILGWADDHYEIPVIYIKVLNSEKSTEDVYYVDVKKATRTGEFVIKDDSILTIDKNTTIQLADEEIYQYYEDKYNVEGSYILHQVELKDGKIYLLKLNSNTGKVEVEEYIKSTNTSDDDENTENNNTTQEDWPQYAKVYESTDNDGNISTIYFWGTTSSFDATIKMKDSITYQVTGTYEFDKDTKNITATVKNIYVSLNNGQYNSSTKTEVNFTRVFHLNDNGKLQVIEAAENPTIPVFEIEGDNVTKTSETIELKIWLKYSIFPLRPGGL